LDLASQAMKHECFNSVTFFSPFAIMESGKILVEASGMIGLWPYLLTSCLSKVFPRILTKIFDILVKGESFFSASFLLDWCLEKIIKGVTWMLKVDNKEFEEYKLLDYRNENETLMALKDLILSASRIKTSPREYAEKIYEDSLKILEEFSVIKNELG